MSVSRIDKGIPIPESQLGMPKKHPWDRMQIGDSFQLNVSEGGARSMASKANKRYGMTFIARKHGSAFRVWRTA